VGITLCLVIVVAFTGIPTALAVVQVPWFVFLFINGNDRSACKYFVGQTYSEFGPLTGSSWHYSTYVGPGVKGSEQSKGFSSYSDASTFAVNKYHVGQGVIFSPCS